MRAGFLATVFVAASTLASQLAPGTAMADAMTEPVSPWAEGVPRSEGSPPSDETLTRAMGVLRCPLILRQRAERMSQDGDTVIVERTDSRLVTRTSLDGRDKVGKSHVLLMEQSCNARMERGRAVIEHREVISIVSEDSL